MKFQGEYIIRWLDRGIKRVFIQDKEGDIPCFERFVSVWDTETKEYLGFCGEHWFRENIILGVPEGQELDGKLDA